MPGAAENRRTPPRSSPASQFSFGSTQSSSESEGRSKVAPRRQSFGNHSWSSNTPTRSTNFRRSRINSSSDTDSVERFAGARKKYIFFPKWVLWRFISTQYLFRL
ncbi:unnamed protein product [Oikopleura dioica]|uniref:Uncharacterized protein n=1 Tax=Oikopleura dioica TaxID=34765 RepID=E4YEI2_OIKDI|nr:unnamed protein product [Oikopleura dioica]